MQTLTAEVEAADVSDHFKNNTPVNELDNRLYKTLLALPCGSRLDATSIDEILGPDNQCLVLYVVRFHHKFWAVRNRRLYAMKECQSVCGIRNVTWKLTSCASECTS